MEVPRWAAVLLRWLAPCGESDDVLGDLEEAHQRRLRRHRPVAARLLTTIEVIEMAGALVRSRLARYRIRGKSVVQDYKLGFRMLVKYPGLTIAGGLALAIAIGVGAGWYDLTRDFLRPRLPLADAERIVEIEMRNSFGGADERRLLHDFVNWRRDARSLAELGAYRTVERNLILGDARPEPVTLAETSPSAFQLARVPPVLGRPLVDADAQPGAEPVVVLGYNVWQRQFGGRSDIIGQTIQLSKTTTTVVGVMPEGFGFPINHRMWIPLHVRASGYAPLEGPPVRIFARLAEGSTQAQANAELTAMAERTAAESPRTHAPLRPRVLAYGGESPGDQSWLEFAITHLPVILVLMVACMNVGTLIYARTATREAEIGLRYALGAGRWRIVSQLFVEALVLASVAAVVGLTGAHYAVKWGMNAYFAGQNGGAPFWVDAGLNFTTMVYAAGLTIAGAAILGVLPALKVTGTRVQSQLRNLGVGGATLRFGTFWTTAMIAQVALTVICLPPAMGISEEALRDRTIRARFPGEKYLAVRLEIDPESAGEKTYEEFERQLLREPGVMAVTFADRLPGMGPAVQSAEIEVAADTPPQLIPNLWMAAVGPEFFQAFDVPVIAGRDFHDSDRIEGARTVLVNEAFARRYFEGGSPVGARVRYASADQNTPEPWLEIVGVVRDIGMTPTDNGEAPYVFSAATPATASPLVMAVRVSRNPGALAPRVREIATQLDAGLRIDEMRTLEEFAWRVDIPMMIGAGAITAVVCLGLFLSAAGIFSLMSVSIARRTREIGLRTALGATRGSVLTGFFRRALLLVGSGVLAGNAVLLLIVTVSDEAGLVDVMWALLTTSAVMLTVGLLACVEPARRALRIQPTEALKEA